MSTPKILTFSTPVDASNYVADFGEAKGIALRGINYETGNYRFSLVRPDDTVASEVNGIAVDLPSEQSAASDVRAVLASTAQ